MHITSSLNIRLVFGALFVALLGALLFYWMTYIIPSDIPLHAEFIVFAATQHQVIPNFLYYLTVYVTAGCSYLMPSLLKASVMVLTLSLVLKYLVAWLVFAPGTGDGVNGNVAWYHKWGPVIVLSLLFTHSLPVWPALRLYLGQFPPNIWHNSTTIFLMPFALLLYYRTIKAFQAFTVRDMLMATGLVIVNILIKPSFLFPLFCTFPVFMCWRYGLKKEFLRVLVVLLCGGIFIFIEYLLIYKCANVYDDSSGIALQFFKFEVWRNFSQFPLLSLFASLFFPAMYVWRYFSKAKKDPVYIYTWSLFVASVLIYGVIIETGPRAYHGNFSFQVIICMFMLFLMTLKKYTEEIAGLAGVNRNAVLVGGAFLCHVGAELLYFIKMWCRGNMG